MTELEMRKLELIAEDVDTICDMTMRKAKAICEQYTLNKCGVPDKTFTDLVLDTVKMRLVDRIGKEIFKHDN